MILDQLRDRSPFYNQKIKWGRAPPALRTASLSLVFRLKLNVQIFKHADYIVPSCAALEPVGETAHPFDFEPNELLVHVYPPEEVSSSKDLVAAEFAHSLSISPSLRAPRTLHSGAHVAVLLKSTRMRKPHEDVGALINALVSEGQEAARVLAERSGLPLEFAHIQSALVEVLGLKEAIDLLSYRMKRREIVAHLANFDFRKFFPELLAEVELENSIIPEDVPRSLIEQTVRCNGEVWRIHRNDADPFPSNPHGHNLESHYKLHLGMGELFLRRRNVGKIYRKHLLAIRNQLSGFDLPKLAC